MPIDRHLIDAWAPFAEAAFSAAELRQQRAVASLVNGDGTINREAIREASDWLVRDVMLPGVVVVDPQNVQIPFPQGARIRHIALSARVAPSTSQFLIRFTSGETSETISLQTGVSRDMTGVRIVVPEEGWLTASVLSSGDAHDVLISLHYIGGA